MLERIGIFMENSDEFVLLFQGFTLSEPEEAPIIVNLAKNNVTIDYSNTVWRPIQDKVEEYDHSGIMLQCGRGWNDTHKNWFNKKGLPEEKSKEATEKDLEEGKLVSKTLHSLTLTQETKEYQWYHLTCDVEAMV